MSSLESCSHPTKAHAQIRLFDSALDPSPAGGTCLRQPLGKSAYRTSARCAHQKLPSSACDRLQDGKLPSSWGGMALLRHLGLSGCGLQGALPSSWSGLASLEFVNLSDNPALDGPLPASWSQLQRLQHLDVSLLGSVRTFASSGLESGRLWRGCRQCWTWRGGPSVQAGHVAAAAKGLQVGSCAVVSMHAVMALNHQAEAMATGACSSI